jgi:hypothetical protein
MKNIVVWSVKPRRPQNFIDVSEKFTASIFRKEKLAIRSLLACFLDLLFGPSVGGDSRLLRNVGKLPGSTISYSRGYYSSAVLNP